MRVSAASEPGLHLSGLFLLLMLLLLPLLTVAHCWDVGEHATRGMQLILMEVRHVIVASSDLPR
jgi:hypothetical protein